MLLSSIFTLCCSSCSNENLIETPDGTIDLSTKKYSDYNEFKLDSLNNFYSHDGTYSIEIYYEGCPHCNNVKPYLFRHFELFKQEQKTSRVFIYDMKDGASPEGKINRSYFKQILDESNYKIDYYITEMIKNKTNTISETYYFGVPTLYVIENHTLKDVVYGEKSLINYYRSLS